LKSKANAHTGKADKFRVYTNDGCWLAVPVHPTGPVTSEIDQHFMWVSSALGQILSCYPKWQLHLILLVQPSQRWFQNFFPQTVRQTSPTFRHDAALKETKLKIQLKRSATCFYY